VSDDPILDKMTLSVNAKTESSEEEVEKIRQITLKRCPAYYCLAEAVTPEVIVEKR
jgi:uncharacterized OsmC-like protein